jgi:hypothetical protein
MESMTCSECTNEVTETDTTCPRCGASLVSDATPAPPLMSVVNEAQPPAGSASVIATRIAAVALIGWLTVLAALSWMAYGEGYVDEKLPAWNSLFVVGMIPIAVGVFQRRLWAQRWAFGTALFTGISTAAGASRADSTLLGFGVLLLGAVAVVMVKTRAIFRYDNVHRGTFAQAIATIALVGSIVMYMSVWTSRGTERGRKAFAAEVQQAYAKAGANVRVYIEGRTLVIDSPDDTDAQVDAAVQQLHAQLAHHGPNAKAWALGFDAIKITNGSHAQRLAPPDAP